MLVELTSLEKTQNEIHKINKQNLFRFLVILCLIDILVLIFATIDSSYPSFPLLLRWIQINALVEVLLIVVAIALRKYNTHSYEFIIPMVIMILKMSYNNILNFETATLLYYMGSFVILTIILLTRWKMLIVGFTSQVLMFIQMHYLNLKEVDDHYTIFIITSLVFAICIYSNMIRLNTYIYESISKEKLLNQKKEIEYLVMLRDFTIDLNHKMISHINVEEYFDYILCKVMSLMTKAHSACILTVKGDDLSVLASFNYNKDDVDNLKIPIKESFAYQLGAIDAKNPMIINNLPEVVAKGFPKLLLRDDDLEINSTLTTPLIMNNEFYGLFNLDSSENNIYNQEDIDIMKYICEQISIVIENHTLYAKVSELFKYDQLTGFYNRWYLKEIKELHYPRWCRESKLVIFAMFDLDNLKHVNDNFGHDVGDIYIKEFCEYLKDEFRTTDIIIRNGGDEFLGIFFEIKEEKLRGKLEAIRKSFSEKIYKNKSIEIISSFSYGLNRIENNPKKLENIINVADQKMYEYKVKNKKEVLNIS
ncbi:MAG: sensor domain-containing diguanylate cyclase [Acidaminobacteraceae bacterium]